MREGITFTTRLQPNDWAAPTNLRFDVSVTACNWSPVPNTTLCLCPMRRDVGREETLIDGLSSTMLHCLNNFLVRFFSFLPPTTSSNDRNLLWAVWHTMSFFLCRNWVKMGVRGVARSSATMSWTTLSSEEASQLPPSNDSSVTNAMRAVTSKFTWQI